MLPLEHSAILLTFINLPFVIKIFVLSFFEWSFYIGFNVFPIVGLWFRPVNFSIIEAECVYGKCSKVLKTSCLLKRPRQTAQTQIRPLLKKQYDQGLPCLLF